MMMAMAANDTTAGERRVIAHVDADAFYASVHLLEDPSLRGKPVVVAGSGPRSIVTTASYEARAFGIGSAQPAARARQLCPHAVFLTPNFDLYRGYARRAMAIMETACDTIEPLSLDEAYLDITDLENPVRAMRQMIADIHAETGLIYSVGIGPNRLCAKVLSDHRKPRAFNVASREQCCELFAGAAPRIIPGIGPKTADVLTGLGIETLAALRGADAGLLERRFGLRRAGELQARASFHHDGVVQAHRETKSVSEETTFDVDIDDDAELEERLGELTAELCERLAQKGLRGRTIGIKVRHADFSTATRARTIDEPTNDFDDVAQVARELLRAYERPQPLRLLGVRVAAFHRPVSDSAGGDGPRVGEQLRLALELARVEP
ncbi:MAG: DNA-directed polymerase [Thermoleophilia bacterium]|nr:DNA-directed polymerase [Thermoleophilia bacterium]